MASTPFALKASIFAMNPGRCCPELEYVVDNVKFVMHYLNHSPSRSESSWNSKEDRLLMRLEHLSYIYFVFDLILLLNRRCF